MEQEKLSVFQAELNELLKKHGVEIFPQMTIGVKEKFDIEKLEQPKEDATKSVDSTL